MGFCLRIRRTCLMPYDIQWTCNVCGRYPTLGDRVFTLRLHTASWGFLFPKLPKIYHIFVSKRQKYSES